MKTLQEIQDEYVKDNFPECKTWEGFTQSYATFNQDWFDIHWKHICVRAQQEQHKIITSKIILGQTINKIHSIILNENNIIR